MTLWLALKNLKAKPLRTLASVLAISVCVAMFFCMFSFESAVYEYVFAVETADQGDSDIMIAAKSGGNRIISVAPLREVEGVEKVAATVSLYALAERGDEPGEYVRLRGFEDGDVEALRAVELAEGELPVKSDDVIVSRAAAEHFGWRTGGVITVRKLTSVGGTVNFYIKGIAENTGYFLSDSPYTVLGNASAMSSVMISGTTVYNEVYVTVSEGADGSEVRERIAAMQEYRDHTVSECVDLDHISTRARNLAAPVTIAGAAVALLCLVGVALVFTSGTRDRRAYAAKLALVGATKKKLLGMFFVESAAICVVGAAIGMGLAVGIFALMLRIVLSSTLSFSVNAGLLVAAAAVGGAVAFGASLYPLARVFRASARENLVGAPDKGRLGAVLTCVLAAVTLVTLLIENLVPGGKGALSAVNLVLVIACAAAAAPRLVRLTGRVMAKTNSPSAVAAGYSAARERRASGSAQILAVGMSVSMLLFTAWSLTTSVFSGLTAEFERMVLVTNVASDVDESEFTALDGVDKAELMVWRQVSVSSPEMDAATFNLLGSSGALELADFAYLTPREDVIAALAEGKAVLDESVRELYGVDVGDTVTLDIDGQIGELEVGGIVRHELFNGSYVIVSAEALADAFGLSPDTVVVIASSDAADTAEMIRAHFADRNYYTVPALEAYEWDTKSLENVFDLIAALAFMLTALAFAVALANVFAGRAYASVTRSTLLGAGLSKNALLGAETLEHTVSAACAFIFALPASALAAMCLIHALRMFGLYFGFMYNAVAAVAAGLVVAAVYALIPVLFGFRRGYGMRRS